jgi:hypothetical protein
LITAVKSFEVQVSGSAQDESISKKINTAFGFKGERKYNSLCIKNTFSGSTVVKLYF